MNNLEKFLKDCFTEDGEYIDKQYYKNANDKTCRFCPFRDTTHLCDRTNK